MGVLDLVYNSPVFIACARPLTKQFKNRYDEISILSISFYISESENNKYILNNMYDENYTVVLSSASP